jgi:hypothetical protein
MRLLRDKQSVERREAFSFGIGTQWGNVMDIFKQSRDGNGIHEYIFYNVQHKPLFTPH